MPRPPGCAVFPYTTLFRSGVLVARGEAGEPLAAVCVARREFESAHFGMPVARLAAPAAVDRKSTRLNSSHANISYAVFCSKKKRNTPYILSSGPQHD